VGEISELVGYEVALNVAGGVALLLWATRMVRTGIERVFGSGLRRLLGRSTQNRLSALGAGIAITAAIQSSTATALLTASFVSARMLASTAALAVMLGADLGSTFVVQLLSFDLSWLSPALLVPGVALFLISHERRPRQIGRIFVGIGLMLLALQVLVAASDGLRSGPALPAVVAYLATDPVTTFLFAVVLTWLAHSSVAVILLIMSLAGSGVIPVEVALALVLGANVGSGLIPVLLTSGADVAPRRVPLGNLLFRVVGAIVTLLLLVALPPTPELFGSDPARQVANFHTLFNLALVLVFLPLIGPMSRLTEVLLRERPEETQDDWEQAPNPSYLDAQVVETPRLAIACATREVLRMADKVEAMLRRSIEMFQNGSKRDLKRLAIADDDVDTLDAEIKLYLATVNRGSLTAEEKQRSRELMQFCIKLEHIGDIIVKNLLKLAQKKSATKVEFSPAGWRELTELHANVVDNMQLALNVLVSGDRQSARDLLAEKDRFSRLERASSDHHLSRLSQGQPASIETSSIHLDAIRDLRQINSHLASIAYPVLSETGELRRSAKRKAG
jgi:phosphate:Na+ symporter